jgi:hypothetical protein
MASTPIWVVDLSVYGPITVERRLRFSEPIDKYCRLQENQPVSYELEKRWPN